MQEFISKHITSHFPKMDTEVPLDALTVEECAAAITAALTKN